jgi:hypothetical protein
MEHSSSATGLTPGQTALRAKCFHPTGTFIEFKPEEIDQSISDRFEDQVRKHSNRLAVKSGICKDHSLRCPQPRRVFRISIQIKTKITEK